MTQREEVENKHLNIKRSHGESDLTVEDHPVESLENHNSSHEVTTDQLGIQTRTVSVRHYSCSEDNINAISIVCDAREIVDNEKDTKDSTGIDDKSEVETGSDLQGKDSLHSETSHLEESYKFRIQDNCSPTIPNSDLDQGNDDINIDMAMTATVANKFDRASRTMDDVLDIANEEEAESRHLDEMRSHGESDTTVKIKPIESQEDMNSGHK